jgi:hypothetical protein
MNIQIYLHRTEFLDEVVHALSALQSRHIIELDIQTAPFRQKSILRSGMTIRSCRVERQEDKTLLCSACGRKLPSTHQGELDSEQLACEMSLQNW